MDDAFDILGRCERWKMGTNFLTCPAISAEVVR